MNSVVSLTVARRSVVLAASLAFALPALWSAGVHAQAAYPAKPVTFVVPFAPGGGTDIVARVVSTRLAALWSGSGGQSVIVDNRSGAGGILGADIVAKARPDGYTLLIGNVGTQSINPTLYTTLPYNADTAFAPISLICELPFVLMTSRAFAPNSIKELVVFAKAHPDKVTFASSGSGGSPHLTAEIFQLATGTRMLHVPYRGGGPAMIDLMGGQVDLLFASILESSGYIQAGKLKGLAVTHANRSPALPNVPTIAEAGVRNAESGSWIALLAPAGTPAAIIDKVAANVKEIVAVADTRDKLIAQGGVPRGSTPAELQKLIDSDRARYGRIIREKGLKAQ